MTIKWRQGLNGRKRIKMQKQQETKFNKNTNTNTMLPLKQTTNIAENHAHCPLVSSDSCKKEKTNQHYSPTKGCTKTDKQQQQQDCNQPECEKYAGPQQQCNMDLFEDSTYAPWRLAGHSANARDYAATIIKRAALTKETNATPITTLAATPTSIQRKSTTKTTKSTIPNTKAMVKATTTTTTMQAAAATTAKESKTKPHAITGSHLNSRQPNGMLTLDWNLFGRFFLPPIAKTRATARVKHAKARESTTDCNIHRAKSTLTSSSITTALTLMPVLALCFLCIAPAASTSLTTTHTNAAMSSTSLSTSTATHAAHAAHPAASDPSLLPAVPVLAAVTGTATAKPGSTGAQQQQQCSLSEFTCSNTRCVPLSKYCNNINDCGDGSDEPRFCTRCNRTYYGDIGLTYSLELYRPKQDRLPYVCVLTFTAAGGQHGDVVQVTLDSFTIGRFTSYLHDGCPDGYMQIAESARTPIGGMWCGSSWGPVLFYSETRSLIFTIKLNKLARDQSGYNFDFRIRYKVLSKDSSVTRYGGIKLEELHNWHNRSSFQNQNAIEDFTNSSGAHSDRYGEDFSLFSAYANNKTFTNSLQRAVDRDEHNYTEPKYYLGDLIPGTYCSRIFSDCDRKACRLQSPNYPGIYPRNLTCYYAVRQHEVPHGKHAMILVKQPKGNLIWISTQETGAGSKLAPSTNEKDKKFEPRLKTWSECDNIQDYVTVYDGYTTRDPIVLKFCGGGQAVPSAVSSGPELLVEFTTSPFGTFTGTSSQVLPLYGFQLDVEVIFVDIMSPTYSKNKKPCEFWIRGAGRGILENPKHSLAPNTTCLYHLQGMGVFKTFDHLSLSRRTSAQGMSQPLSRFKVWISMMKFNLDPEFGQIDETSVGAIGVLQTHEDCTGMLRIWDGALREPPACKDLNCASETPSHPVLTHYTHNLTNVIARFCRGTIPRTCDRSNINETYARPCTISESYVSSSDSITLELKNTESTVLRPLEFKLKYEFIDLHQDGLPLVGGENDCNRKFVSSLMDRKDPAIFRSVRNIFLFGRGGTRNLKCIYKFEGQRGERIRIKLRKVTTLNRPCMSRVDEDINRSFCYGDTNARIEIFERPYHDSILLPRGCLCNSSNSSHLPVEYTSTSRDLEVHFTAINMTTLDDPDAINFEGMFEFIKGPANCKDGRRKFGPSGTIQMTFGDMECRSRPWLIEPSNANKFLYVRLKAIFLRKYNPKKAMNTTTVGTSSYRCETKARVVLTTSEGLTITACPLSPDSKAYEFVEIFSSGWNERPIYSIANRSKAISVEYLRPENGDFTFNWMELVPRPVLSIAEDCQYKCSELGACVNASVWCDGIVHCPSGDDETFLQCSAIMKLPTEILATLCLIIVLLCCAFAAFAYKRFAFHCRKIKRKLRGSSVLQTRLKSLSSMDTAVLDEKEVIC